MTHVISIIAGLLCCGLLFVALLATYILIGMMTFDLISDSKMSREIFFDDEDDIISCLLGWPIIIVRYFKIRRNHKGDKDGKSGKTD